MKIALAQINPKVGDIDGNLKKILTFARSAKQAGASLAIFPELAICGYPPMDLLLKDSFIEANLKALNKIAEQSTDLALLVGFADLNKEGGRPLFNACAYLQNGKIKGKQYKTLLPSYDVFDEDRYFEPASTYSKCQIGDFSFGFSICEDIWSEASGETLNRYRLNPIEQLAKFNPDFIVNISASPFTVGKSVFRENLLRGHATTYGLPIIFVNQVGGNDQLVFDGRSMVVDRQGKLSALAKAFEEDLLIVDLPQNDGPIQGEIKEDNHNPISETYSALVLGTKDYLHKCNFKKAVVGLSGGIDSAVTCAIACQALGKENVVGIAMPSPYSSPGSLEDASQLAKNLGIEFNVISIEPGMKAFDQMLADKFKGLKADTTEENVQARLRGSILMAISNKFNYLVLTTGNKSELAVGYCTLYGDMCGGLAVISDIPKLVVYELAAFINARGGDEIIPRSSIEKPPSAELRPNQKDEDSLPPYAVLDAIINAYVEQRLKPDEIVNLGYKSEVVAEIIQRIDRNEYKRKQAPPGLKVTSRAFGVGWRMPIAQGFRERTTGKKSANTEVLC